MLRWYFRLDDLVKIAEKAFGDIGKERWVRACDHVERVIAQSKKSDGYKGHTVDRILINLAETSTDDNSDTETASVGSTTDTASEIEV